jgi:hypothetical protein
MKKNQVQYRQGDVMIERVPSLPTGLKKVARENGRVILAHGDVTGHAHVFVEEGTQKFTDAEGAEYFEVRGSRFHLRLPILRKWRSQVLVRHSELGLIEFAVSDIEIEGNEAVIAGEFGFLRHDEHNLQGIPAGSYRGAAAGKKVYQREYSPEEIRRVAD